MRRALLADPRLLILDEATSSIDALTEARIQRVLATLPHGRTSFGVAHRLRTIRHADLVRAFDLGRIIDARHACRAADVARPLRGTLPPVRAGGRARPREGETRCRRKLKIIGPQGVFPSEKRAIYL